MLRSILTAARTTPSLRLPGQQRQRDSGYVVRLFTTGHPLLLLTRSNAQRPQLPFLAQPGLHIPQSFIQRRVARVLSTENKQYVREQTFLAAKWSAVGIVALGLLGFATYSWKGELIERVNPSPPEWSYFTRSAWRSAWLSYAEDMGKMAQVDWARQGEYWRVCLMRLEDQTIDGHGIEPISPQGAGAYNAARGLGPAAFDVTSKSEAWKAGYVEAVMKTAMAAEHLQATVFDRRQSDFFPKATMVGPSNKSVKQLPPGIVAPREEDCEPSFPDPAVLYNRVAYGIGFSIKQRIAAMHAHANWLEFNHEGKAAEQCYQYAIATARSALPSVPTATHSTRLGTGTKVAISDAEYASATPNLVSSVTAHAIHLSRNSRTAEALPVLLSALGAVRHAQNHPLPNSLSGSVTQPNPAGVFSAWSAKFFRPDEFPLPLRTGDEPLASIAPLALKCKEAELMTYIGEILFIASTSKQEDGLTWTRTAIDGAATALRQIVAQSRSIQGDGSLKERERERKIGMTRQERARCTECVVMGLTNWEIMASKMNEEPERTTGSSWWRANSNEKAKSNRINEGIKVERLKSELIQEGLVEPWAFITR